MFSKVIGGVVRGDKPATRENWNNFINSLHEDGVIEDRQVNTWANPY